MDQMFPLSENIPWFFFSHYIFIRVLHIWTDQPFFAQWIFAVWKASGDLSNSNFLVSIVIILVMTLVAGCPVGVDALIMVIKGSAGCGHQMHVFHISSPPPRYLHLDIQTKDLLYKYTGVSKSIKLINEIFNSCNDTFCKHFVVIVNLFIGKYVF